MNVPLDIIVGVPGAFSPQCTDQVPGYLENAEKFASKGVQGIYVVPVNDVFTVKAWKEKLGGNDKPLVHFLADDEAKVGKQSILV
jgi:2-Cys peroxiredoxin 5